MSVNVHTDIDGGGEYLPFALAKLKSLRATGLRYAAQSYQVGDATIKVRIEGDHSYVRLRAGGGGYVCLPHSDAHPYGVLTDSQGNAVEPKATVTIGKGEEAKPKVKEHKAVVTGSNDWRGKVGGKTRVITYSAFPQRYRFFGSGAYELPNIYDGGKKIETECLIPGVGFEVCGVKGAGIVEFEGKAYYLMATSANQYPETRLFVFYRQVGTADWKFSVTINAPQDYAFTDPVYFSPDGKKFNTLARWRNPLPGSIGKSKKVAGTAILQIIGTTARVGVTHTTSGELMVVTKDEQYSDLEPPTTNEVVWGPNITWESGWTCSGGGQTVFRNGLQPGAEIITYPGTPRRSGSEREYMVPVAFDYADDGTEIPVSLNVTRRDLSTTTTTGSVVDFVPLGTNAPGFIGQELISICAGGQPTGYFGQEDGDAAAAAATAWLDGIYSAHARTTTSTTEDKKAAELVFGSTVVHTFAWYDYKLTGTAVSNQTPPAGGFALGFNETFGPVSRELTMSFPQVLAADARTGAVAVVKVISKPATTDQNSQVYDRKVQIDLAFGSQSKTKTTQLPSGVAMYQAPAFASAPHTNLTGWFAKHNYASVDGKTFMFSVSPDEVLDAATQHPFVPGIDASAPPTNAPLNWMTNDKGAPGGFFTIGGEPDFKLFPITVF